MDKLVAVLIGSPVHSLLIVAGLFFLLLAIVSKLGNVITVPPKRQKIAVVIGAILLLLGLSLHLKGFFLSPPSSPKDVVVDYLTYLNKEQFAEAKKLHPAMNIKATARWMKAENRPEQPITSINLVEFLAEDISETSASLTVKMRYCREDGSGTDEEKVIFLKMVDRHWIIQNENHPRSVKMIRCF
ncbi:hypothetical protein [Candidatus Electrothrix sp.]|uniref:hypothetical protein n=1 Tax=Candidatus Electrothrix sp. TaxID=2170559 RepID=UPI0040573828